MNILSGREIRIIRLIYNITADEISRNNGFSLTKISRIENGHYEISNYEMKKIENALCKIIREKTEES